MITRSPGIDKHSFGFLSTFGKYSVCSCKAVWGKDLNIIGCGGGSFEAEEEETETEEDDDGDGSYLKYDGNRARTLEEQMNENCVEIGCKAGEVVLISENVGAVKHFVGKAGLAAYLQPLRNFDVAEGQDLPDFRREDWQRAGMVGRDRGAILRLLLINENETEDETATPNVDFNSKKEGAGVGVAILIPSTQCENGKMREDDNISGGTGCNRDVERPSNVLGDDESKRNDLIDRAFSVYGEKSSSSTVNIITDMERPEESKALQIPGILSLTASAVLTLLKGDNTNRNPSIERYKNGKETLGAARMPLCLFEPVICIFRTSIDTNDEDICFRRIKRESEPHGDGCLELSVSVLRTMRSWRLRCHPSDTIASVRRQLLGVLGLPPGTSGKLIYAGAGRQLLSGRSLSYYDIQTGGAMQLELPHGIEAGITSTSELSTTGSHVQQRAENQATAQMKTMEARPRDCMFEQIHMTSNNNFGT